MTLTICAHKTFGTLQGAFFNQPQHIESDRYYECKFPYMHKERNLISYTASVPILIKLFCVICEDVDIKYV